jgi:hypothetical protein
MRPRECNPWAAAVSARFTSMRPALLGLLFATTGVVHAAPIATASEDIDGDGAKDTITLDADGTLVVGKKTLKLAASKTGRIEIGRRAGKAYVVVVFGSQAAIVADGREVLRFPIGGVGLDADYGVDVAASDDWIIRYQTRPGVRRCDGKPALVFAEGFDGAKFQRRSDLPTLVGTPTTVLAKVDGPSAQPMIYLARVASHQIGAGDAGGLGIPAELDDGKPATMWREELGGTGKGQWFTFETRTRGAKAKQLRVVAGGKTFNRPRGLAIVGEKAAYRVELADTLDAQVVDLPDGIDGCVTVVLESTYGPDKGQTAIAEMSIYADGERASGGEAMLAKIIADGGDGALVAGQALAKRGAAGATALEAEILKTKDARARRRLLAVIAKIDDATAAPMLVRAATEGWAEGDALVDIVRALGRRGMFEELAQLASKSSLAIEARVAAAEAISADDPKSFALLVDLAGTGPHALRKVVIERLANATMAQLIDAAQKETEAPSAGDLWRATTRRAKHVAADRPAALAAMQIALPAATDYERRYRLIDGVATLGDAAALRALQATLRALPAGSIGAALRQVAVAGAASAPRVEALSLVTGLANDPDPGVRLAVLSALAGTEVDAATPWHAPDPDGIDRIIVAALATDTWPDVRRRAASSLGLRCQRPGPRTALVDALGKDKETQVRSDALVALVQCRALDIDKILAMVWDGTKMPVELRTQAVSLVAVLGDKKFGALLVRNFARWRSAAISAGDDGEAALELAVAAAPVIAILDAPGAVQALTEALYDEAFPEIVAAAATALGKLGPKCPASAKAKLVEISKSGSDAARAAELAITVCGNKAR